MPSTSESDNENHPIIIAIGASAGGLGAVRELIDSVKPGLGVAYLILIHHQNNSKSLLTEILQRDTKVPVIKAKNESKLSPDQIYVLPPDHSVERIDSHLHLAELDKDNGDRAPIDRLFRRLGESYGNKAVGVVLSGTGSDGTLGLKAIHMAGGLTIAQDPESAEFDGMPRSSISTGVVDKILKPNELFPFLSNWVKSRKILLKKLQEDEGRTAEYLNKIFHLIKRHTGRDFYRYKENTILRRIERRMQVVNIEDLEQYHNKLMTDKTELVALSNEFLINVTGFFRDQEVFRGLQSELISKLVANKSPSDQIRVWCVGCATGEEAYSVAIQFFEEMRNQETHPDLQVFASDMHAKSLETARLGFYHGKIETDVSEERLRRYFQREDGGYRVKKMLREVIVFALHNVLNDPPFSNLDLIVCRNLLIYLKKDTQKDVFELFHYSLKSGGHLLLGNSEHLDYQDLYEVVDKEISLHRRLDGKGPETNLPVFPKMRPSVQPAFSEIPSQNFHDKGQLHYQLVEKIAPPSILIDSRHRIMHISAHAGKYLSIGGGILSKDLFDLLRTELIREVKTLIFSTDEKRGIYKTNPITLAYGDKKNDVVVSMRRVNFEEEEMTVLFFDEFEKKPRLHTALKIKESGDGEMNVLQKELLDKQQELKIVREEYEANREEMKASNEELQSANEELRSTMEELETSKEELQSMNEELVTLNQENRHKVDELRTLSDDLQNLLASTEIATLFLDREFRILRFTPKLNEIFNVRQADQGRKISDQTNKLGYDSLIEDGKEVLKTLRPIEREVNDHHDRTFLTRILPYRSSEDRIEGIVITFVDISILKNAEKALRISEEKYRALIDTSASLIWHTDEKGMMGKDNTKYMDFTGFTLNQVKGRNWLKAIHKEDVENFTKELEKCLNKKSNLQCEFRIYQDENKTHRWHYVSIVPLTTSEDESVRFIGMGIDIDDRKRSEADLTKAKERAEEAAQAREDFLAHMSHEIRSPLNSILGLTHILLEGEPREDQEKLLHTLHLSGAHLKKLVNDILDLSQLRAGKNALNLEQDNLADIMEEIIAIFQYTASKSELDLSMELDSRLDKVYELDRLKLTQVLNNLLSNAFKFTKKGSITLSVKHLETKGKKDLIRFAVKDTGIGVEATKVEKIFDNFSQADTSTKREYGGTGLGLTLCKKYVEVMGGEIKLKSKPGDGSEFSFELALSHGKQIEKPKKEEPSQEKTNAKNLKVLVVDDSEVNRMVIKAFLGRFENTELAMAKGGRDAIRLAKEEKFDLILMDIRMPVVDGYAATAEIRKSKLNAETVIIALTADISQKVKDHVNEDFFHSIITKPIEPDELEELIEKFSRGLTVD